MTEAPVGRWSDLTGEPEVAELEPWMDFREPRYRREVFLRFYEFHLKYRAHPGAVYYMMPYLQEKLGLDTESALWMAFINGCSQNIITTYLLVSRFPDPRRMDLKAFSAYFRQNYEKFGWDTDRRYVKNSLEKCVESYLAALNGRSQEEFFTALGPTQDKYRNFETTWDYVINNFYTFGRLATFSYLEYLRIVGLNLDCNNLYMDNITGSKSHRNGLCRVLGRDDLDWWDANRNFAGYTPRIIAWLTQEGGRLLEDAKARIDHKDVSYFTLESTLCCYKGWHRPNRRYPNIYNDMFHDRIKHAEAKWGRREDLSIFWNARKQYLPTELRKEDNPHDPGLAPIKQNHYLLTGQVIMMDREYPEFVNDFNLAIA
jgi:hypothetical protein